MSAKQDAEFEAGFAAARGDELPTELENTEEPSNENADNEVVNESEDAPEEKPAPSQEDILSQLSKIPELESLTKSEVRKIYGKFGEMQQALNAMQTQPTGKGRLKVSEAFREEYGDLADLIESSEIEGVANGSTNIEQELNVRVEAIKQDFERKILTMQHKDWVQVKDSPEFLEWVAKQDAETQSELANSYDALYIGEKLTEFKSTRNNVATNKNTSNATRLEDAMTPTTKGAVKPRTESEDDAFESGFKVVRGIAA